MAGLATPESPARTKITRLRSRTHAGKSRMTSSNDWTLRSNTRPIAKPANAAHLGSAPVRSTIIDVTIVNTPALRAPYR